MASDNQLQTDSALATQLAERIRAAMPSVIADLSALVPLRSVNFPGYDRQPVLDCANRIADLLRAAGAPKVDLVDSGTGVPTIRADVPGPAGSPTVLLYSHFDVQPAGDEQSWDSDPWVAQERAGRLYGRGAADDKSGVVTHLAVLRAFAGKPPVHLRILLEGEEEYGGAFEDWPHTHPQVFEGVDAAVINDMGNVEIGQPTFTTQLRGIIEGVVTVRTLAEPRHSGQFGGAAPDALMVLIKILATLADDRGDCAIDGIPGGDWAGADFPEDVYKDLTGFLPGVPRIGSGSVASQLYARPSVTVVGLDAPSVAEAPNALIPEARAKVSVRIPADADPQEATAALAEHLASHTPWGVTAEFEPGPPAAGSKVPIGGPAYSACAAAMEWAYGRPSTAQGMGGAVPFVANLIEAFPRLEVLGIGAQDPMARIHAPNESIHLGELADSIVAEALFLAEYAERALASPSGS